MSAVRPKIMFVGDRTPWGYEVGYYQLTRRWLAALERVADVELVLLAGPHLDIPVGEFRGQAHYIDDRPSRYKLWIQARSLASSHSMIEAQFNARHCLSGLQAAIDQQQPDLIIFNHLRTAWLLPRLKQMSIPAVYLAHNCEAAAYRSMCQLSFGPLVRTGLYWESLKLEWLERQIIERSVATVALSTEDADRFRTMVPQAQVVAVGPPVDSRDEATTRKDSLDRTQSVLLIGSFSWAPKRRNAEWLADEVFQAVRRDCPHAELKIVGTRAEMLPARVSRLPGVSVFPNVPDVAEYYRSATVAVVPEGQRGGIKLKTLEAASYGLPIVTTSAGCEGTGFRDQVECLIADSADDFSKAIVKLLNDPVLRKSLSESSLQRISENFSLTHFEDDVARFVELSVGSSGDQPVIASSKHAEVRV